MRLNRRKFLKAASGLFVPMVCGAQEMFINPYRFSGPASECTTVSYQHEDTTSSIGWFGANVRIRCAIPLTPTEAASICAVSLWLRRGAGSGTFYVSLWSNNAGSPGSMLGGESAGYAYSTLSTTFTEAKYPLSSPATVTTDMLWVVVRTPVLTESDYIYAAGGTIGSSVKYLYSDNGTSYYDSGSMRKLACKFWK